MGHPSVSIPHDTIFQGVKTLLQREHITKVMHASLGLTTGTYNISRTTINHYKPITCRFSIITMSDS